MNYTNQIDQLIEKYKKRLAHGENNLKDMEEDSEAYRGQKRINVIWIEITNDLILLAEKLGYDTKR